MSTSVSQNQSKQNSSSRNSNIRRSSKTVRGWITVAGVILMLLVGFFVIRTQGRVSGVEFAPTHFQIRDFSFYEIPLLHHQITPIHRKTRTGATANYLRQKSLIPPTNGPAETWHLVSITRGLTGTTSADASFLVDQLALSSAGKDHWRQWSIDHPAQAALLWPQIQKLADRELYLLIPALLELVSNDSDAADSDTPASSKSGDDTEPLKRKVDQYLQDQYLTLIQDMTAADREPLAANLLAEALSDYPEHRQLKAIADEHPDWKQYSDEAQMRDEIESP